MDTVILNRTNRSVLVLRQVRNVVVRDGRLIPAAQHLERRHAADARGFTAAKTTAGPGMPASMADSMSATLGQHCQWRPAVGPAYSQG